MRNDNKQTGLSGIAWLAEAHYSANVQDPDLVQSGQIVLGDPNSSVDVLNGTTGLHLRFGQDFIATFAYSAPMTDDRLFDGEFRMIFNKYFGGQRRRRAAGHGFNVTTVKYSYN